MGDLEPKYSDDEPEDDDLDGGSIEACVRASGRLVDHEEVERQLGIP